jgi:hypothetical protein
MAARDADEFIDEPDRPTADAIGEPPRTGRVGGEARCARTSSVRGRTPPAAVALP